MKTYMTVLRALLMLATICLLMLGALFSFQHWSGSKNWLWTGLLLFILMIVDHFISKRILSRQKADSENNN